MNAKSNWIDLSLPLQNGLMPAIELTIEYYDHRFGADHMSKIFGVDSSELPNGLGWAGERVSALTHAGTHMDAPYHYSPSCGGQASAKIDALPLEWCVGPAVVLNFRSKADGELISALDLQRALAEINHVLSEGDIVLIETGRDEFYYQPGYADRGPGMSAEATRFLIREKIRVIGIDTWGFDLPFSHMRRRYESSRDPREIWQAHYVGIEKEYIQLERLANLAALPRTGARVYCFPIKIHGAGGAWCRVVAEVFS